jgi:hypothetical protein
MPSILGGGDVIALALVEGTPLVGLIDIPGVIVSLSVVVGVPFVVGVSIDPVVDVSAGKRVSPGTGGADGTAQPPSKTTIITIANNSFPGFTQLSSSPRSQLYTKYSPNSNAIPL